MEEIVEEVLKSISDEDVEGDLALGKEKPVPISKENFHSFKEEKSNSTISFVDGGNAELFGAASFSLQLLRVATVEYRKNKKTNSKKEEFYLLICFEKGKFEIKTFPEGKLPSIGFDSLDPSLRSGNERVVANKIGGVCRRLAELQLANTLETDFIVLDGDLHERTEQEKELLEKLEKKNICGLSKTSNLITEQGRVFAAAINSLKSGDWFYHPVFENKPIYFVKLHKKAQYVFKVDMFNDDKKEELFSLLKNISSDPVFLGYPYGLIEVDRLARVSNKEKDILKTKFMAKFGKEWGKVRTYLRTTDAHSILDSVG